MKIKEEREKEKIVKRLMKSNEFNEFDILQIIMLIIIVVCGISLANKISQDGFNWICECEDHD